MKRERAMRWLAAMACVWAWTASAAETPSGEAHDWVAHYFRFHNGEVMPELKLHYTTVGAPTGMPVLVLHGTGGTGTGLLAPGFGGVLFGPGQPLDAARYYIILPDSIGTGGSSKPSNGMRASFPHYNYDDMVQAQYRLVTEGLGLKHLRLVLGNSMGGMQAWDWGVAHPGFMDALVPMAAQPTPMAARNWMLRKLLVESVRGDPSYNAGNYASQPPAFRYANAMFGVATSGGTLAYQANAGTHAAADAAAVARLAEPLPGDANDYVYQWESSADYDPSGGLERITAAVLAINSADDERNPMETGVLEAAMKRVRGGSVHVIPASGETRGHGTTGMAKFWATRLGEFLASVPPMTD